MSHSRSVTYSRALQICVVVVFACLCTEVIRNAAAPTNQERMEPAIGNHAQEETLLQRVKREEINLSASTPAAAAALPAVGVASSPDKEKSKTGPAVGSTETGKPKSRSQAVQVADRGNDVNDNDGDEQNDGGLNDDEEEEEEEEKKEEEKEEEVVVDKNLDEEDKVAVESQHNTEAHDATDRKTKTRHNEHMDRASNKKDLVLVPIETPASSNFMTYFIVMGVIVVILYIAFHNRHKILAYIIEGRRSRSTGQRRGRTTSATASSSSLSTTVEYHRLTPTTDDLLPTVTAARQ